LTVYDIKALDDVVSDTLAMPRFITTLVGFFAALAPLLSALGIYGVTSYSVSRRTQEIGVRIALGALTSILYGITPGHLPTFAVVATILFGVVTTSSYVPARRASRIAPMQALRDD